MSDRRDAIDALVRGTAAARYGRDRPPLPADASEAERLAAARAVIERMRRVRSTGPEPDLDLGAVRGSGLDFDLDLDAGGDGAPPSAAMPSDPEASDRAPDAASSPSRVRPRGLRRDTASGASRRAVPVVAAALVAAVVGTVAGRATAPPAPGVATLEPGASAVGRAVPGASSIAEPIASGEAATGIEDGAATLRGVLRAPAVAAIAEADRALELIEFGSADPGADPADLERARARVRETLVARIGRDAVDALDRARAGR